MYSQEQQTARTDEPIDERRNTVVLDVFEGNMEVRIKVGHPEQGRLIMQQLRGLAAISPLHVKFADLPWTIIRS